MEAIGAHVIVSKYADHLLLRRQVQIYARQGLKLARSTLADLTGRAAWMLRPVHERLLEWLKASEKLFADETTAPVLDPRGGRTKTGLWADLRKAKRPSQSGGAIGAGDLTTPRDSHSSLGPEWRLRWNCAQGTHKRVVLAAVECRSVGLISLLRRRGWTGTRLRFGPG